MSVIAAGTFADNQVVEIVCVHVGHRGHRIARDIDVRAVGLDEGFGTELGRNGRRR
jgi:hypothetical protein